jgi:hypothetical protein
LLPERTAPELLYLETKWCSLLSFGVTLDLLKEVLPIGEDLNMTTIRNNLHQVAERMESEMGEERAQFVESAVERTDAPVIPPPKPPLAVGLDGAYVHAAPRADRKEGWFEVIVGKSINAADEGRYVASVHTYDQKPKRRLYEAMKAHGWEADQAVSFFSDGEDTLHRLQMFLSEQAEYILDWFHITMRLTVISQMRKGMAGTEEAALAAATGKDLESLKWHLWNGNIDPALRVVEGLKTMLAGEGISGERQKLLRAVREFGNYIAANQACIPDYGDRYRNHERISTAFTESAVNQLVSRRMVKLQQMQWTERGAHLLLQVRVQVMNGDLRQTFCRWYPGMKAATDPLPLPA